MNKSTFEEPFQGPFKISEKISGVNTKISDGEKEILIHNNRIATIPPALPKRKIKIPEENLQYVKKNLPSFLKRGEDDVMNN